MSLIVGLILICLIVKDTEEISCITTSLFSTTSVKCSTNYCQKDTTVQTNGKTLYNLMCSLNSCCKKTGIINTCTSGATTTCCNAADNCNSVAVAAAVSSCYVGGYYSINEYSSRQSIAQTTCVSPKNQYCASYIGTSTGSVYYAYLCTDYCIAGTYDGLAVTCCQTSNCNIPSIASYLSLSNTSLASWIFVNILILFS